MRSPLHRCLLVASLLGPLAFEGTAAAQDIAAAEALFNSGMADLEAGRYETACQAIAESQRLDPRPGTLFTLATCEERWGHIATAVTRYGDYLSLYERLPPDRKAAQGERPKVARTQREKLAADVPELTLSLPPETPAGTVVKRDGQVLAAAALRTALPVDPGEHTVSTQIPGGPVWEQRFTIRLGEKKNLALQWTSISGGAGPASRGVEAPQASAGPASRGVEAPQASGWRTAGFVIGGAGILGLGAGVVAGVLAIQDKSSAHCNAAGVCASGPLASARHAALASDVGLIAGGVLLAGGVTLVVLNRVKVTPAAGTNGGGLVVGGRF
jgi:hypothetical protein